MFSMGQRQTARILGSKVRIYYPYHPYSGKLVEVVARSLHDKVAYLTIVQSDGTLAKIPTWMTDEGASAASIVEMPVLPLAALLEVRSLLDRSLRCEDEESSLDSGNKHDIDTSPSTASVRPQPRSSKDPTATPNASSEVNRETSPGGRIGWKGSRKCDQHKGDNR